MICLLMKEYAYFAGRHISLALAMLLAGTRPHFPWQFWLPASIIRLPPASALSWEAHSSTFKLLW
jgi:hypothetical protein